MKKSTMFKWPTIFMKEKLLNQNVGKVLRYFYYLADVNKSEFINVRLSVIAKNTGIKNLDESYISKLINKLIAYGFIKKYHRYHYITGKYISSVYEIINYESLINNSYVLVPTDIFNWGLTSQEDAAFIYYLSHCKEETYKSLAQIKDATKLSKTTIIKATKVLVEKGLLACHQYRKKDGSFGHNHYYIISKIAKNIGEKNAECFKRYVQNLKIVSSAGLQIIKKMIIGKAKIPSYIAAPVPNVSEKEKITWWQKTKTIISQGLQRVKRGVLRFFEWGLST